MFHTLPYMLLIDRWRLSWSAVEQYSLAFVFSKIHTIQVVIVEHLVFFQPLPSEDGVCLWTIGHEEISGTLYTLDGKGKVTLTYYLHDCSPPGQARVFYVNFACRREYPCSREVC